MKMLAVAAAAVVALAACGSSPPAGNPAACKAAMLKELQDMQPETAVLTACRGLPQKVTDRLAQEAADEWAAQTFGS